MTIDFNRPFISGKELDYISEVIESGHLCGDGIFTKKASEFLENFLNANKVLLTHSCTAALEMAAILCDIDQGDEVILPSYTFVSTANAFLLRGAKLVFADIREEDCNIDPEEIEKLITSKTKVICVVHYAGVACDMDRIMEIAREHSLFVVEDAAQALGVDYKGKKLGTIGDFGTFSFHETKNLISGEGGALVINNKKFVQRAEIIREKGTNRRLFLRGEIDKYSWVDVGSSYLPSELVSAFLFAQLENIQEIFEKRKICFLSYYNFFSKLKDLKGVGFSNSFSVEGSNHHIFYLLMPSHKLQQNLIDFLREGGIKATFHYVPLHSSPMGEILHDGRELPVTEDISKKIVRLPLFTSLEEDEIRRVCEKVEDFIKLKINH